MSDTNAAAGGEQLSKKYIFIFIIILNQYKFDLVCLAII
jgi:hypothetical protein